MVLVSHTSIAVANPVAELKTETCEILCRLVPCSIQGSARNSCRVCACYPKFLGAVESFTPHKSVDPGAAVGFWP
jgi:hypothetical protein